MLLHVHDTFETADSNLSGEFGHQWIFLLSLTYHPLCHLQVKAESCRFYSSENRAIVSLTACLAATKESAYLTIKPTILNANVTPATVEYHAVSFY